MLYVWCALGRFLLGLFIPLILTGAAVAAPTVSAVRIGPSPERTRFVLELSDSVQYQILTLTDPYRVVIDFQYLDWSVNDDDVKPAGLITSIRFGRFTQQTSRVVLDLAGPAEAAKAFILPRQGNYPVRFVLDLKPVSAQTFAAEANKPYRAPAFDPVTPAIVAPVQTSGKHIVVVDAGHGGIDPGTLGRFGPDEKVVTLSVARELKRELEATGRYTVVLTRDHDIFLPLRERVEVARHADADLFISIHADSISNARVRGATVYTLSEKSSDREAAALAQKENRSDIIAGVNLSGESDDVTNILIDLAQRETMNNSAEFAQMLVPELGHNIRMGNNPHRFAGFVVLKAPDVPSVLIEVGYLSNKEDAKMMYSKSGQKDIAAAIVKATDRFFNVQG